MGKVEPAALIAEVKKAAANLASALGTIMMHRPTRYEKKNKVTVCDWLVT